MRLQAFSKRGIRHLINFMRTNLVINALCLIICFHIVCSTAAQVQPVSVSVLEDGNAASLAPGFLGLSYESSILLPQNGHYYFDSKDAALINTFKTLGIKIFESEQMPWITHAFQSREKTILIRFLRLPVPLE